MNIWLYTNIVEDSLQENKQEFRKHINIVCVCVNIESTYVTLITIYFWQFHLFNNVSPSYTSLLCGSGAASRANNKRHCAWHRAAPSYWGGAAWPTKVGRLSRWWNKRPKIHGFQWGWNKPTYRGCFTPFTTGEGAHLVFHTSFSLYIPQVDETWNPMRNKLQSWSDECI